jgi:exonuclease SbcD
MKILHTSDWHIGRTFHSESTIEHLKIVLAAVVESVRENNIDVVVIAGDVFDSPMPAGEYVQVLDDTLADIREAGAHIVMTSGNHDSAKRLGYQSRAAAFGGIHVFTRPEQAWVPAIVEVNGESVAFYGIPYLEPRLMGALEPDTKFRTHEQVLRFVMEKINADRAERGGPSVVIAHCFAADVAGENSPAVGESKIQGACEIIAGIDVAFQEAAPDVDGEAVEQGDVEIDITAGGLGIVALSAFDGPDYVALGHLHGRHTLTERIRYSGAVLHYSFGERSKLRGGWILNLTYAGLGEASWIDFPVPRRLTQITGPLENLLTSDEFAPFTQDWVKAIITDQARPLDAMRQLQGRFPHCAMMSHEPTVVVQSEGESYAARVNGKTDRELVTGFVEHVRNGVTPSPEELGEIDKVLATLADKAAAR